jgi:CHAT domain-containing protein
MTTYSELRLRIDRGVTRGSYRIVATGPAGEALGRFKLPFSELELENFILKVGSTRRGRRRVDSPEMELAKNFGTKLFGALFEGDVRELYRSSYSETRGAGRGLRLTLSLTGAPELLQVPWEYLYDHPSFLSISTWTPIVRYLDLPKPRRPLQIELPLRILALVSAPADAEVIDAAQERLKLEAALAPLIAAGAIAIDWLEEASLRALQRQLRKADYHVFHYIGHGGYDQDADDGVLLFEDEGGRGRRVSGVQLGTILADEVSLRLAVLNSCEGGRSSLQDPFSGVATSLIEREIPAVIGMQFEITDRAAIVFAGEFYAALADGLPVDSSVAEARKAIYADENDIEWGTPVLFMRVADGRLFEVQPHAPLRAPTPAPAIAERAEPQAADATEAAELERAAAEADANAERDRAAAAEAERIEAQRVEQERERHEADANAERERAVAATAERVQLTGQQGEPREGSPDAPGLAAAIQQGPNARPAKDAKAAEPGIWDVPPGLTRAGLRAGLGGVLTAALSAITYLIGSLDQLEYVLKEFVGYAGLMAIAMVATVIVAEGVWPAVRAPEGSLYRSVGGSRWGAAAIQGTIVGAIVGTLVVILNRNDWSQLTIETAVVLAVCGGIAFAIAEAVLDRLSRRRARKSNPA